MQTLSRQSKLIMWRRSAFSAKCTQCLLRQHFCNLCYEQIDSNIFYSWAVASRDARNRKIHMKEKTKRVNILIVIHKMHINKFSIQPKNWFMANIDGPFEQSTLPFFKSDFQLKCFHLPEIKELCHCLLFFVFCSRYRVHKLRSHSLFKVVSLNEEKWNLKYIYLLFLFVIILILCILIEWIQLI